MSEDIPKGIILRVEKQKRHRDIIEKYGEPLWIMIDIHIAKTFLKYNMSATNFPENINIITTTTIPDDRLTYYFLEEEFDIINKFRPKYHIPCDFPVYDSQPNSDRIWFLKMYLSEIKRVYPLLKKIGVGIIPLIKGTNERERTLCYKTFTKDLDLKYYACYVSNECGKGKGRPIKKIANYIRDIAYEIKRNNIKNYNLMVIGHQSSEGLNKFPPQVICSAGQSWIKYAKLGKISIDESCKALKQWKIQRERKLCSGDEVLGD